MAKLVCNAGPNAGHEYRLTKDLTTLGRQSTCDVPIHDHRASRQHCQVRRDGRFYTLIDLGSRNGVKLNERKIKERQLAFGDKVRVGDVEWLFVKEAGDIELKDLITRYELAEKIGEGGMGVVYKANQKSMQRIVALKILAPKYASKTKFVEQFVREARAAGQLNHPNIIQVHDVASENDLQFFSMEYVDGPTCAQILRTSGAFPLPEALEIARQVARALEYAHEHRLIHQDIKPDNIMIGQNNLVKLADLGISKTFDEAETEEGPKRVMGTPHYMAPEAALGKRIDHRVDLYSLGATLYHLLTNKTAHSGTSAAEVLKAQVMDPLPPIHELRPEIPEAVCALIEKLLSKKPEDRPQSATAVVEEIRRLQTTLNLGSDSTGGGDTILLQKLAAGANRGGDESVDTPEGTDNATRQQGEAQAQALEAAKLRQVAWIGGIVVVLLILVLVVVPRLLAQSEAPAGPIAGPTGSLPATAGPTANTPVVTQDPAQRLAALVSALETRANKADADPAALLPEVESALAENPPPAIRTRAERLRERLQLDIQHRHAAQLETALTQLSGEVRALVKEKNHQLALDRIEAFPQRAEPTLTERVNTLREEITKDRDRFLTELNGSIASATGRKDSKRLAELRDQLPKPLLGSDIERQIQDAITKIDAEVNARHIVSLKEVATELVKFDTAKTEERHRMVRPGMGDNPAGATCDGLLAAARDLPALVREFNAAVLARESHKLRFVGELGRLVNPGVIGANASGVLLEAPSGGGGEIVVAWKNVPPDAVRALVQQVLGDDGTNAHRATLDAVATAHSLLGP